MKRKLKPAVENKAEFFKYYEENNNWMTEEKNPLAILKSMYPQYFYENNPDYKKIKTDILKIYINKPDNKAHEVFKSLFKMPYKTTKTIHSEALNELAEQFGKKITAHGVEECKGGMYNLLLICISNEIRVPPSYWGPFVDGPPNISPLSHGPYFIIYSMPSSSPESVSRPSSRTQLSDVAQILVPFIQNKEILIEKLEDMVKVELITKASKEMFINKLVTYDELLCKLNSQFQIKKQCIAYNRNSLFNSDGTDSTSEAKNTSGLTPSNDGQKCL